LERPPDRKKCPLCGKPTDTRFRPFCSKRCADLDLAHWLRGDYADPAREAPEGEEEFEAGAQDGKPRPTTEPPE
jgi:endogenous inhibitor of DNA gyrase (YacG/DUF329 family)